MQYTQHLLEAGLTHDQATLYETLIKEGPQIASRLARLAKTNRTLTYKLLDELESLELVEGDDTQEYSTVFIAKHPNTLQTLIDDKLENAQRAKVAMSGVLSSIISDYNKISGQPGVRILEGEKGMREALSETLQSDGAICTYADLTTIHKYAAKENKSHMQERIKKKINKRVLVPNTSENIKLAKALDSNHTEVRLVSEGSAQPFSTAMEIYDGKISYLTFGESLIATIIEDKAVYTMHRYLFDDAWKKARRFN